jgi:caffeic acid 3-O-methyltransferase
MAEVPAARVRQDAGQLMTMSAIPAAVAALARLNVFQALAQAGPDALLTASELAALAVPGKSINVSYLARLLRMMAGQRILREVATLGEEGEATERRYGLEPIARFLVDDGDSFLPLLLAYQDPGFLYTWEHIHESVLDDSVAPFTRAHGVDAWEYAKQNPEFDRLFNRAMAGHSEIYMRATLDVYRGFEPVKTLVDVGGGFGSALRLITARYPHIKAINFDQPHVFESCPPVPGEQQSVPVFFESFFTITHVVLGNLVTMRL